MHPPGQTTCKKLELQLWWIEKAGTWGTGLWWHFEVGQ
jgi:hypothetical protein